MSGHPSGIENSDRAAWAESALQVYVEKARSDWESAAVDLLTDLMHLADRDGDDFNEWVELADQHYTEEKEVDEP